MKETELAQRFVDHFSCYDLYFEVDYYRCIDIVVLANNISMAVEVKTSFNFKVLAQAIENRPYFNFSYVAVPDFKDSYFQRQLCEDYGIGLLVYCSKDWGNGIGHVKEMVKAKLNRKPQYHEKLRSRVSEMNKQSKPGSKSGDGGKVTAFGITVKNMVDYVKRHPGCDLKKVMESISHHYRTDQLARSNTYQWIRNGVIKELEIRDRKVYLKPQPKETKLK